MRNTVLRTGAPAARRTWVAWAVSAARRIWQAWATPVLAGLTLALVVGPARAGETTRVSVSAPGVEVVGAIGMTTAISANGRVQAIGAVVDGYAPGDANGFPDIVVRDAKTGQMELVSVSSLGEPANGGSSGQALSANGRWVAFHSYADNLVPNDTNGVWDVFVHDRKTHETTRVSVTPDGTSPNADSLRPSLSSNGRWVAFQSSATDLVADDTNEQPDIFVHDRKTGTTVRASESATGAQADGWSQAPWLSGNGRYVAFESRATNLVTGDTTEAWDVYVKDLETGAIERASVTTGGDEVSGDSMAPTLSADGRLVAFHSWAPDVVPDDANDAADCFLRDLAAGTTVRISLDAQGGDAAGNSLFPQLSANGRWVAFESNADDLVPGDENGTDDVFLRDLKKGTTQRVSVAATGAEGDAFSKRQAISGNGRFVAFSSWATNLAPDDNNGFEDAFVYDRKKGTLERISVCGSGVEANSYSEFPDVSGNGRFVAFSSWASNLVPGDTNGFSDIFVHDGKTGLTERVSLSVSGAEADRECFWPSISDNGRWVAFEGWSNKLVPGDAGDWADIFVRDRKLGTTERVSVTSAGMGAEGDSSWPEITGNGRFVTFVSFAPNLVPGDENGFGDVFIHDRKTKETTRVSVDSAGAEANEGSGWASASDDGRQVAFLSWASNLVPDDTNDQADIFVHDRTTGETRRVSVNSAGDQATNWSDWPRISGNGRYVAFHSDADNLVPGDGNAIWDVFVHDLKTGETTRVSVDDFGFEANGGCERPTLSKSGRWVAFTSWADNLVPDDTNGLFDDFVHDRKTGETIRVSLTHLGDQATGGDSMEPALSANGKVVAFHSFAPDLVPHDGNGEMDVFVRKLK